MAGDLEVRLCASVGGFGVDVEFRARPGVTVLFGPSGSGKSTTLSAIAGLIRPDAGRIAIGEQVWFDSAARVDLPVERRRVAVVFQSLALFPHMSALDNVVYGIDRKLPRAERRERAAAMLVRMRVGHLGERQPRSLSGGEAQRVALARAFAMAPAVVLLDEAFSALDRELRRELLADVRRYIEDARLPAIQVTHHRMEARAMADRVVMMRAGRVVGVGAPDEMLHDAVPEIGSFADIDKTPIPRLVKR